MQFERYTQNRYKLNKNYRKMLNYSQQEQDDNNRKAELAQAKVLYRNYFHWTTICILCCAVAVQRCSEMRLFVTSNIILQEVAPDAENADYQADMKRQYGQQVPGKGACVIKTILLYANSNFQHSSLPEECLTFPISWCNWSA